MRITKTFIAKLESNLKQTLDGLTKDDLVYVVKKANEAYHAKGAPLFSDAIFDAIKDRLENMGVEEGVQDVGALPVAGKKVTLPYYMGSMDKIKTDDRALENFRKKFLGDYLVTDKLDGISALLYVTRDNVNLYTRGDGKIGQDITHLLSIIRGVPSLASLKKIVSAGIKNDFCVRGELILTKTDFETVKDRGANARNMVAGIVNAKKPDASIAKLVSFVAYTMISPNIYKPSNAYEHLIAHGFNVVHHQLLNSLTFDKLSDILVNRRRDSPFEIDGIVVSYDDIYALESGKNPTHAFAFKNIITQETAEVIVTNVEWNASKDGYLVPVVEFDPIHLSGVMVKRASGFNGEYIKVNGIGPGARIIVTRSGDVIPYIVQVVEATKPSMPDEDYEWTDTGKDIYIKNKADNKQVQLRTLENFFSKLSVAGMKAGTITKLFDAGYNTLGKILSAKVSDIAKIDGFQQKSAEKIVDAIKEKLAALSCVELMDASNAFGRGFGSKRIAAIVAAIPAITKDTYVPTKAELVAVDGVSDKTAEAFLIGLKEYRAFKELTKIRCDVGEGSSPKKLKKESDAMVGEFVVFTGFRDADLKAFIESNGGTVQDSVNKKTTILVAKDLSKATGKVQKAEGLGIKVFNLDDFKERYKV